MGKINFVASWFTLTLISFLFVVAFLVYLSSPKIVSPINNNFRLYAALPEGEITQIAILSFKDGRYKSIDDFFKKYSSPLKDYGGLFVKTADTYNLDWRLLPAIAMQESHGGKKIIKDSYNPFGFGIYGNLVVKFSSWEEGIVKVAKALKEDYYNRGLKNPSQIMTKYTPPSLSKGGTWAKAVSSFMEELR